MANNNIGFLLLEDWIPAIESLDGADVKELILALVNRQLYGIAYPTFTNKQTEIYARMIEPTIKRRLDGQAGGIKANQKGTTVGTTVASKAKQSNNKQSKDKQSNISPPSSDEGELEARFERFYASYPNKRGKADALKAFKKIKPSEDLLAVMISAIEDQKTWESWTKENGKFIPYPATWLNRGQWQDEQCGAAKYDPDEDMRKFFGEG